MITFDAFEELLGAYALDALDADEAAAVEEFLTAHPEHEREVQRLRAAAAWIGASEVETPPARLRSSILARIAPASAPRSPGAVAHDAATDLLRAVVGGLAPSDAATTTWNGLDVHDLVVHLLAMESLVAQWAGRPTHESLTGGDIEGRTYEAIEAFAEVPITAVIDEWDRAARAVRDAGEHDDRIPWFGADFAASDVLTYRAFETWTHAGDIAVAMGGPRPGLPGDAFASMARASMGLMPLCLARRGTTRPGATAEIVLTGDGGGRFTIPLAPGEAIDRAAAPQVRITTSVFDWCVRVAERIEPDELDADIAGDVELGCELVAAASCFATL